MNNDREYLMQCIYTANFAIDDVKLFLDTHPCDPSALAYYEKMNALRRRAMDDYNARFGPLSATDVNVANGWTWVDNPCPWEVEAN